jgi:TetR/AcrR family transcriptional regulator, transcriptional repressor for nem operon
VARPREFDETCVLEAAMNCFWSRGYETTSVRDLADQMGITGASLYNAFGDKRSLYRRSLEYYLEQSVRERIRLHEGSAPLEAIEAFFREVVNRSVSDKSRRGCMLVNAALEIDPRDPEFQEVVAKEFSSIEAFFGRCIKAGQEDGSLRRNVPAAESAKMLLSVLLGIRVLARSRPQRSVLEGALRSALTLIRA